MLLRFYMVLAILSITSDFAQATDDSDVMENGTLVADVSRQLLQIQTQHERPLASLSVAVIRNGRLVYEQAMGARYLDQRDPEKNLPAQVDTLYRVASVSKMVTAIAVMRLCEQGRLNLDTDIGTYLGYPVRHPNFPQVAITLRMLLSHTSSLRDDGGYNFPAQVTLRNVFNLPGVWETSSSAQYAPGQFFSYVNLNWGVIGSVMEAVTGQRFDVLMSELVLQPLQIQGSFHPENLTPENIVRLATLYRKQKDEQWNPDGPWYPQVDDRGAQAAQTTPKRIFLQTYQPGTNATLFSPQGGLRISVQGLSHIMLMLMQDGEFNGRRFLSVDSLRQLTHPEWRYETRSGAVGSNGDNYHGLFLSWGLGMQVFTGTRLSVGGDQLTRPTAKRNRGFTGVGHLGFAYGLQSAFIFDAVSRDGMIYLIGGAGDDPDKYPGQHSGLSLWEEEILAQLVRLLDD